MATIIQNVTFDLTAIDLHRLFTNIADFWSISPSRDQTIAYYNSIGLGAWGSQAATRIDSGVALSLDAADEDRLYFAGHAITATRDNVITGGTVTDVLEVDTVTPSTYLAMLNISVSAVSIYRAMLTTSTADDAAVFAQVFAGNDSFTLSNGADKANGMAGNDVMSGMGGNDTLWGAAGADTLNGGLGNDALAGGIGNDSLTGGIGRDVMTGGDGADRFVFQTISQTGLTTTTTDVITDFRHGIDKIVLTGIDASSAIAGNDAFVFLGTGSAGTAASGAVTYRKFDAVGTANDYTLVYLDTDRDAAAEAVIRLTGLVPLTAADFLL